MIFSETKVMNFEAAFRGMRNPMDSWDKSDSRYSDEKDTNRKYPKCDFVIGENDLNLAQRLIKAGGEHRKFMRQILVSVDIEAPLYWWKEFDTYKIGTVSNSTSTMHKIHSKPIKLSDFELDDFYSGDDVDTALISCFMDVVDECEELRQQYLLTKNPHYWRGLIQLLPESYKQKRTITMSYENIYNMIRQRKNHKLKEWKTDFIIWARLLPYAEELLFYPTEK